MIFERLFEFDFFPVTIYLFVIPIFTYFVLIFHRDRNLPPGPRGLPFIGSISTLSKGRSTEVFMDLQKKYGDIFSIQLGQYLYIVVNGYDTLRDVFVTNGDLFAERPDIYLSVQISRRQGINQGSGELWRRSRAFAMHALRGFGFGTKSLESKIVEEVDFFLRNIKQQNGKPYDMKQILHTSISNIICSIVFSEHFDENDKTFERLFRLLDEGVELIGNTGMAMLLPVLRFVPGDPFSIYKCLNHFEIIHEYLGDVAKQHQRSFDEHNVRDFVDAYIKEKINKEKQGIKDPAFSELHLVMMLRDFFAAGTETSASTIRLSVLFLIHYRHIQSQVYEEIKAIVGLSRPPCLNDQKNTIFFNAFLTEVMRIKCVIPLAVTHGVPKDIQYKGFTIPKRAIVVPNLDSVMKDPALFPNPDKFDPSRFIGEDGQLTGQEKVIAFSLGKRVCMGEALARNELFLFLTTLIQRFELLPEDEHNLPSLDGIDGLTYRPRPYKFRAVERQ